MATSTTLSDTVSISSEANSQLTKALFGAEYGISSSSSDQNIGLSYKRKVEYGDVQELPPSLAARQASSTKGPKRPKVRGQELVLASANGTGKGPEIDGTKTSSSLVRRPNMQQQRPDWHAPWKLMRVISGHLGWVRSLAVEPDNQWFASGSGDRTIKIWNLATGDLKLTLTGHISTVRGLAVSKTTSISVLLWRGQDGKMLGSNDQQSY